SASSASPRTLAARARYWSGNCASRRKSAEPMNPEPPVTTMSSTPLALRFRRTLAHAVGAQYRDERAEKAAHVHAQRQVFDVFAVKAHLFGHGQLVPPVDLRPAGDARAHGV